MRKDTQKRGHRTSERNTCGVQGGRHARKGPWGSEASAAPGPEDGGQQLAPSFASYLDFWVAKDRQGTNRRYHTHRLSITKLIRISITCENTSVFFKLFLALGFRRETAGSRCDE